jgi:hypothetical protein
MDRPILKTTWNAGFFSCCTDILRQLTKYHYENKKLPILDSSEQWELYKDDGLEDFSIFWFGLVLSKTDGDISENFFKQTDSFDEFNHEAFSSEYNYPTKCDEDQYSDYRNINYQYIGKLIDTYFKPSEKVTEIFNNLINKYNIDLSKTISILFRGNDKRLETNLPTYDELLSKTLELLSEYPDYDILVQSDEFEFCEFMKQKLNKVIIIEETKKINRTNTAIQYTLKKGERVIMAQTFLSVIQIIANSSHVILNSGNVGLWSCLYRKNFNGVHQYLSRINTNNKIWIEQ